MKSPVAATLILAAGGAAIMLIGEKRILILVSGNVSDYLLISLAVLRGRKRGQTGLNWRAPLHPMVPVFGLTVTALSVVADWLDPDAGRPSIMLLTGLFLGALAYYHFRLRQVSKGWLMGVAGSVTEYGDAVPHHLRHRRAKPGLRRSLEKGWPTPDSAAPPQMSLALSPPVT